LNFLPGSPVDMSKKSHILPILPHIRVQNGKTYPMGALNSSLVDYRMRGSGLLEDFEENKI
jgi:hypothetical protein